MTRIHRIEIRETNCYLLQGASGTIIIDPGPLGGAATMRAGTAQAGIQPEDVRLIFVTHGHLDHYGVAPQAKDWCSAPVATHPSESAFSQDRRNALPPAQTLRGSVVRWFYLLLSPLAQFAPLQADIPIGDGEDLSPYGVDARVVPGAWALAGFDGCAHD
jgi:glyoxylase-like metal-dependent hydrolase (beta-lactamase superfamily II)